MNRARRIEPLPPAAQHDSDPDAHPIQPEKQEKQVYPVDKETANQLRKLMESELLQNIKIYI